MDCGVALRFAAAVHIFRNLARSRRVKPPVNPAPPSRRPLALLLALCFFPLILRAVNTNEALVGIGIGFWILRTGI